MGFFRRSVCHLLLAIALVPMLIVLPILLAISIYRWSDRFDAVTITRVRDDLTISQQYLTRSLNRTRDRLIAVGESSRFRQLLRADQGADGGFVAFLDATAKRFGFDFVYVVADDGKVIATTNGETTAPLRRDWPVIVSALGGQSTSATDVFDAAELAAISPPLAERARIDIVPAGENMTGPLATGKPWNGAAGGRGASSAGWASGCHRRRDPAQSQSRFRRYDQRSLLLRRQPAKAVPGTATLFLDDIRISTNVRLFGDRRAIGTRVSPDVRTAVLDDGETWLDSAFVVNDWYVSAYEPVLGSFGHRVGMLCAGFLEAPYMRTKYVALFFIAAAFLIAVAMTVPLFLVWARSIFKPLERMSRTITRVEVGHLAADRFDRGPRRDRPRRLASGRSARPHPSARCGAAPVEQGTQPTARSVGARAARRDTAARNHHPATGDVEETGCHRRNHR